jgi:hypothetical protein
LTSVPHHWTSAPAARTPPSPPPSDDTVKLGDFGIARPLDGTQELASTVIGTPFFMSPELMQGIPYDFKSDIWSLGCCCYEMMALQHAFDATDMPTLVVKILQVGAPPSLGAGGRRPGRGCQFGCQMIMVGCRAGIRWCSKRGHCAYSGAGNV